MPIALLGSVVSGVVKTMCVSLISEKLLMVVVKSLLKRLVDSSANTLDNELYEAFCKQLEEDQAKK
tara:strand:+ start:40 stop:237 length:198 start_codon:yes stop_codon:yes gene_type:complete